MPNKIHMVKGAMTYCGRPRNGSYTNHDEYMNRNWLAVTCKNCRVHRPIQDWGSTMNNDGFFRMRG